MSRIMVVAFMRIRSWFGAVGVGIGILSLWRAVDGAGLVGEYGVADGAAGWTRMACILGSDESIRV